jgi:uncharacterized caspase-like protein
MAPTGPEEMAMRIALVVRFVLVAALTAIAAPAFAGSRVALVIGNSDYAHVAKLPNPVRDATAIAQLLKDAGFDHVEQRTDLGIRAFRQAMREFAYRARGADMAVVFYAGHGMEVGGNNYLIPTDAKLKTDLDIEDEVMPLDRVLRTLEAAHTRLVILDACRDNPFLSSMARLSASRSMGRGLARIEPNSSDMLIAFAAKAGSIAADGQANHSPFTTALVKHVAEPGLDIRLALGKVRDDVLQTTHGRQEPFVYGSLGGNTVAIAPSAPAPVVKPAVAAPVDPTVAMRNDYQLAERVGTKEAWDLFLARYPDGAFYADLARAQIAKLAPKPAPKLAPEPLPEKPAAAPPTVVAMAEPATAPAPTPTPKPVLTPAPAPAIEVIKSVPAPANAGAPRPEPDLVVLSPAPPPAPPARPEPVVTKDEQAGTQPAEHQAAEQKSASLTVPAVDAPKPADENRKSAVVEAIRNLQLELKRVGCDPGGDIGIWSDGSKRALEKFNRYAGTQLMVNVASIEALDTIKTHTARVCPLTCRSGYHADGERCVRGRKRKS